MNKSNLLLFLLVISLVSCESFGDKLRTVTDKYIFGTDASKRTAVQAIARDVVHGVWHTGSAISNYNKGNMDGFANDVKRAVQHFSGENYKQRDAYKGKKKL